MAVDYTQHSAYSTSKNTFTDLQKNEKAKDNAAYAQSIWSGALSGASLGATLGGGFGAFMGAIVGAMGGGIVGAIAGNPNEKQAYSDINSNITNNLLSAREQQKSRNEQIANANYLISSTRSSFESTYGKGAFSMLESTIQSLLNMDQSTAGQKKISELLGNLDSDTIIGQIETRILNTDLKNTQTDENGNVIGTTGIEGRINKSTLEALNSSYVSLSDLGNQYVSYLYESILNGDNEIADSAKQLSEQESYAIQELDQNIAELSLSNQQKFAELFLNQRSSNISNAQELGETQASAGASGIKASKASRTSANAQKLQADIANASYGIMLDSYKKSLESSIKSNQLSRAQVFYSYRQQMNSLKRQTINAYNQSMNEYLHGGTTQALTIGNAETEIDTYMAGAQAGKDFLTERGQKVSATFTRIDTTDTATR
jgi:outer membrane lipoprotein SlyB